MMGRGHAVLGIATWCLAAPAVVGATGNPISAQTLLLGAVPVAGAALIPDIDHPNASIANSGGPITKGIAQAVGAITGGHREGTHQLWFFALVVAAAFATVGVGNMYAALGWYFVLSAFGAQALAKSALHKEFNRKWKAKTGIFAKAYCWAFAAVATCLASLVYGLGEPGRWWWLPWAVAIGHASHLLGDSLTTAGLNLGWPVPRKVRFPVLGDAGSQREKALVWGLTAVIMLFMGCAVAGTSPYGLIGQGAEAFGSLFQVPAGGGNWQWPK